MGYHNQSRDPNHDPVYLSNSALHVQPLPKAIFLYKKTESIKFKNLVHWCTWMLNNLSNLFGLDRNLLHDTVN